MALSLKESRAIAGMADLLYEFLPGSGSKNWTGHITFYTVATKVGVGDYWPGGSKKTALVALLEQTLQYKRKLFESLILEIVRASMVYRQKKNNPLTLEDIDTLNGHILEIGFKFPDLWDSSFRESLRKSNNERAKEHVEKVLAEQNLRSDVLNQRSSELAKLKEELFALHVQVDRRAAGFSLEKLLNKLFSIFGLIPRASFRVVGEQIDGSFELDHEVYLVEAKWEKQPLPESDLLVFRGKIEGKSEFTRGMFIALNDISTEAKEAITRGKRPTFFILNGYDLMMILSEDVSLIDYLRQRRRLLAEEGLVVVPYAELWSGSRNR